MNSKTKWTNDQLVEACKTSKSIRQVLSKLNLKEAGGNYSVIKRKIADRSIDISHFTGQIWNKGLKFSPKPHKSLNEILTINSIYPSHKLRIRLLRDKIMEHKCSNCNNSSWLGNPIPLELEHINGIHSDNRLENLTLLCPNCHSLTPTYRGKNIKLKLSSALSSALPVKSSPNLIESQ